MNRYSISTMVLAFAAFIAVTSLIQDIANKVYMASRYDDSPAIVVHDLMLRSAVLKSGEPLEYIMEYTKRADCAPPLGRGAVRYVLWDFNVDRLPNNQVWRTPLTIERDSRAASGQHMKLPDYSVVPVGNLQPGQYAVQWEATYYCANGSTPQEHAGPLMNFEVVN